MKKKILIITHFFYPEIGAASLRMKYFAEALSEEDFEIRIVSPRPNYPNGTIYDGFEKNKIYKSGNVTYLPIFFSSNGTAFGRMLSYISYFIFSFTYLLFNSFKPNTIISSTPPLFTALVAAFLSKIKKSYFILDIRDIWPDIGIELGILKNNITIYILRKIEKIILKSADFITVTANGDKENLIRKNINSEKIITILNGADYSKIKPISNDQKTEIRLKYNLPKGNKILVYFGSFNYGMNDVEILSEVINLLNEEKIEYHFLAIGEGSNKEIFIKKINDFKNVTTLNSLSAEELSYLLPACNISIIPRKFINNDTGGNIPVKCFESWAAGLPVVLSSIDNTEIVNIFNEVKGGIVVKPQSPIDLKNAIIELLNIGHLDKIGAEARENSKNKFSRTQNAQKLVSIVNSF